MLHLLKPFEAKDTASFEKRFNRSLVLLTLFYSVILCLILFISGAVTYSAFSNRIGARFNRVTPQGTNIVIEVRHGPTMEEVREDLVNSLILVNEILLIIAIALSYGLAKVTLRPLKQAYDEQRRFIGDASHELRTPLAILQMEFESGKVDAASGLEEVKRMAKIVNDLLILSKLENNEKKIVLAPLDLEPVLQKIVERMQHLAKSSDVALSFHLPKEKIVIKGNAEVLSHVMTNFIQNAISYNKPKGSVDVSAENEGGQVSILVKDTGVGISAEDQKHIFDRFYRADKSRNRGTGGGSGLGLSIAERGVRSLGGTIQVESEVDKGTLIRISFPRG